MTANTFGFHAFAELALAELVAPTTGGTIYSRTLSDSAEASDTPARQTRAIRTAAEIAQLADTLLRSGRLFRATTDGLDVTETGPLVRRFLGRIIQDNLDASDVLLVSLLQSGILYSRTLLDSTESTDQVWRSVSAFRAGEDALTVHDALGRSALLYRVLLEPLGINDALIASITIGGASILVRTMADELVIEEFLGRSAEFDRVIREVMQPADAMARYLLRVRALNDPVSAADAALRTVLLSRILADDAAAIDSIASEIRFIERFIGIVLSELATAASIIMSSESASEIEHSIALVVENEVDSSKGEPIESETSMAQYIKLEVTSQ